MRFPNMKQLLLTSFLACCLHVAFSQTQDTLSVFPNPFSSSATIHFELAQSDTVTLRLYSMLGQSLVTYFQATVLPSGTYNINLLGDSLAEGFYLIRLEIGTSKVLGLKIVKAGATSAISAHEPAAIPLIFPNPARDYITIPIFGDKTIIVSDLNGKILKSLTTELQTISLSGIATGPCLITVLTDKAPKGTSQIILKGE